MKRICFFAALLCTGFLPAAAQSVPVNPKPGSVSEAEVAMTVYERDTTAAALALVDKTEIILQTSDVLEMKKQTLVYERIKVLKEDGKSWADYKIPYFKDEFVTGIKVTTYNMENGKVTKSTLDKKSIFREKVTDKVSTCSFSAPDVRVGSVIEVSYKMESDLYWDIPESVMQRTIPVNMASTEITYPDFLTMNRMTRGYILPAYQQTSSLKTLRNNVLSSCLMITDHYSMVDVPAVPRESFSMSPSLYRSTVSYEVAGVTIPGQLYRSYSLKWEDVDKQVLESPISTQCYVKGKFLDPFKSQAEDEAHAIAEVRNAVLAAVKWDKRSTLVPDNVRSVLKSGTGSSASINAVVASVLNEMGYKAHPMLLCCRSRGLLSSFFVSAESFTDMMLYITAPSGKTFFLDAAPDYGYVGVVDPDYLVEEARVVVPPTEGLSFWQDLTPMASGTSVFMADARLEPDGLVKGSVQVSCYNEASFLVRQTRDQLGTDEKYFQLVEKGEDFELVSGEYKADDYAFSAAFSLEFEQEATSSGEMVYIKPFLIKEHHQDDFPPGERHLPVDFPFREAITYIYSLQVPDGYVVEQLPPTVSFRPASFKAWALCQSQLTEGNIIKISFSFKNDALQVLPDEYGDLRAFWEKLCNIYQGTIVLKKQ